MMTKPKFYELGLDGVRATFCDAGASIYQIELDGVPMLYTKDKDYFAKENIEFFGQFVAPVAGRIKGGTLKSFHFPPNEGLNANHSGGLTLCWQHFDGETYEDDQGKHVRFTKKGELFDGHYEAGVDYCLHKEGEAVVVHATLSYSSDVDTPCNLTLHPYFCLGETDMAKIFLKVNAKERMSYDKENIPQKFIPTEGEFNLREGRFLDYPFDHAFHLDGAVQAQGERYQVHISSPAPYAQIYVDAPSKAATGASKGFACEFQYHPKMDEDAIMSKNETSTVEITYRFERK